MADEVTRKDLQSLQGFVNKKLADVDAKAAALDAKIAIVEKGFAAFSKRAIEQLGGLLREEAETRSKQLAFQAKELNARIDHLSRIIDERTA